MPAYKFRILVDTEKGEDIFRDILISSTENFELLYRAIITSYDFYGDQLASFYVSNDNWDKGHEIALMDMGLGNDLNAPFLMQETSINTIIQNKGQKLILVYDFLKMWCFLIELIEITPETIEDPILALSVGDSPDENSKEIDLDGAMGMGTPPDLGNHIDDIFSGFNDEDEDDLESFENIDDLDI